MEPLPNPLCGKTSHIVGLYGEEAMRRGLYFRKADCYFYKENGFGQFILLLDFKLNISKNIKNKYVYSELKFSLFFFFHVPFEILLITLFQSC